jgi:hypothetical protein
MYGVGGSSCIVLFNILISISVNCINVRKINSATVSVMYANYFAEGMVEKVLISEPRSNVSCGIKSFRFCL